ncbi:MAG: hypothetical protein RL247_991 [Actinomycetota bacterium]
MLSSQTSNGVRSMTSSELILVRPLEPLDRQPWERLFHAYGVFYEEDFSASVMDGVWQWLMQEDHPLRGFAATLGGELVGIAHLRHQHDTFTAASAWFLDDLFTSPEARGKGVATALIEALDRYAAERGGGTLRWITAHDNDTAQSLYNSLATKTSWVMYERETGDNAAR